MINGRRHLDPRQVARLCEMVAEGQPVERIADQIGASVQATKEAIGRISARVVVAAALEAARVQAPSQKNEVEGKKT